MKNTIKSLLIIVIFSFFTAFASAATCQPRNEVVYTKVETVHLPRMVKSDIALKYAAYVIEQAFIGSDDIYKIIIRNQHTRLAVYYDDARGFVKKECIKAAPLMVLL